VAIASYAACNRILGAVLRGSCVTVIGGGFGSGAVWDEVADGTQAVVESFFDGVINV
jgi:hypothetical protein